MIPRWSYLIKPYGKEYNNTKTIADEEFVINTSIEDATFVNRLGVVCAVPSGGQIPLGSLVVVHHNVFRTYLDMRGEKRKSNEYFRDGQYLVNPNRIYLYADEDRWKTVPGYCFVSPVDYIQDSEIYRSDKEKEEHVGLLKYGNIEGVNENQTIGFTKNSEYEFVIDNEKLYRMRNSDICIKFNEDG
jgi:hypothetical protein